jgi:hypothetical protein
VSYERSGAWTVDHALRVLATGCAEWQRPVPALGAVILGPASVALRLTTPDEAPPTNWTVSEYGRTWTTPLEWVQTAAVDDRIPEPYPLLVSAGIVGAGRLLLNLAEAYGLISIGGDPSLALTLARTWSRRLAVSPWAAAVRVVRVGFAADPQFSGWDMARLVTAAPVLDDPDGGILFLAERPLGRDLYQIERLLSEPARRWSVVAVGADDATWRFTVRTDGTIDTGLLAEPVRPRT